MYFSETHFLEHTDVCSKIEENYPYKEKYLIKGKQIEIKQ